MLLVDPYDTHANTHMHDVWCLIHHFAGNYQEKIPLESLMISMVLERLFENLRERLVMYNMRIISTYRYGITPMVICYTNSYKTVSPTWKITTSEIVFPHSTNSVELERNLSVNSRVEKGLHNIYGLYWAILYTPCWSRCFARYSSLSVRHYYASMIQCHYHCFNGFLLHHWSKLNVTY